MKTVILAAGFGSRLWPLSTSDHPKQFQLFLDNGTTSLLQHNYRLLRQMVPPQDLYIVTLAGLEHFIAEQLPSFDRQHVFTVPERRNTLPHTLYALCKLQVAMDEPVLICPSDQYFDDPQAFIKDIQRLFAEFPSENEHTYLLCSPAAHISSSFGYLKLDARNDVMKFIEKPEGSLLKELNGQADVWLNTLRYATSKASMSALLDNLDDDAITRPAKAFLSASETEADDRLLAMPFVDISHGLFEKVDGLKAWPIKSTFLDVGNFRALYELNPKDEAGNVVIGRVLLGSDAAHNFVVNQTDKPLVVIGNQHSVIVQTTEGNLVSPFTDADTVGEIYKTKIHT